MSHGAHMNESCHTYEWVMSHIWMSHVTHMNESCHTYKWVMSHKCMIHVSFICHLYVLWYTSMSHIIDLCDMTHSYLILQHTATHCNTLQHINGFFMSTMSHMWKGFMSRIRMSDGKNMNESCRTYEYATSRKQLKNITHVHESCHTYQIV